MFSSALKGTAGSIVLGAWLLCLAGCSSLGPKMSFGQVVIYYQPPVQPEEVQKLGNYLTRTIMSTQVEAHIQLLRQRGVYQFLIVIQDELQGKPELELKFKSLGPELSREVFQDVPVEIHLCDKYFQTYRDFR